MTVIELIERLQEMDPDLRVICSRDPEGNEFCDIEDVYDDMGYDEEDVMPIEDLTTDEQSKWPKVATIWAR